MNYRHAFHAGNHADVLKHVVLIYCLAHLRRKETPFAVLDTHAGVGLYDLAGEEAARSPEWRDGIEKLWGWNEAPAPVAAYLEAVAAFNADGALRTYPGSPALIARALRPQDRLAACELHPEDAAALKRRVGAAGHVQIHQRDGWAAMGALLPFPERRGLVLIDPAYEAGDEMERSVAALKTGLKRFAHGTFLWWRPLKDGRALDRADAELAAPGLRADFWIDDPMRNTKLVGSSMYVINPPFGLEDALREALPALSARLTLGASGWALR
ncbi:MAG: 23S rRNA (adenine(2030)-N(6))-methyltransferase RlmJ [Hyphomonadaceae bacterium]|nr:23S rRNA (adenine(2030)-N(6))-methyltransferase RlmJ [Hyphomonadaceae bacterium]